LCLGNQGQEDASEYDKYGYLEIAHIEAKGNG
jgi:hypothetical protein